MPNDRHLRWPKKCLGCGQLLGAEAYPLDSSRKSGRYPYCKPCKAEQMRERNRKIRESGAGALENLRRAARKMKVDVDEILELNEKIGGRCELCGGLPTGNHGRLVLDHNHKTEKFRGLLCGHCNTALGMMQDNPELLRKAARYLEERSK